MAKNIKHATKMKIKTGDKVAIIAGKDKGATSEVIATYPKEHRVKVQGVAMVKKTMRPTQMNPSGGIKEIESKIDVSNAMLVCPHCDLPTRVGKRRDEDNKGHRVCKRCGKDID